MKIAVVGSGISGLSAAYYLSKKHKVDLFEKNDHFGGHAHTIKVPYDHKKEISVDIGFMVFNKKTYPNLIKFFSACFSLILMLLTEKLLEYRFIILKHNPACLLDSSNKLSSQDSVLTFSTRQLSVKISHVPFSINPHSLDT